MYLGTRSARAAAPDLEASAKFSALYARQTRFFSTWRSKKLRPSLSAPLFYETMLGARTGDAVLDSIGFSYGEQIF